MKLLLVSLFCCLLFYRNCYAQEPATICITDKETVDLVTLLDASERDIVLLTSCKKLVKDLYKEIDVRDVKVESLTKELINAKQDSLKYLSSSKTWRTVAIATSLSTITLLLIIPAL